MAGQHTWRESVLSTRSLGFPSTADALASPGLTSTSRNASHVFAYTPTRKSNMTESEIGTIPELPDSVAESPLFDMPREIRDRIYSVCLGAQGNFPMEWPMNSRPYGIQPQLLRTCKIVYSEAAPMLYGGNIMTFHHPSDANMFVRALASMQYAKCISQLNINIKAGDMRLWMPYITSTDPNRSLQADFPSVREIQVRFRSTKWQHTLSVEQNMESWNKDSKLMELLEGLRSKFITPSMEMQRTDSQDFADISSHEEEHEPRHRNLRALFEARRTQAHSNAQRPFDTPVMKVLCACRVHQNHFDLLVNPPPTDANAPNDRSVNNGPIPPGLLSDLRTAEPVLEGQKFERFTAVDLQNRAMKLDDSELGSANVSKTPFADMGGILIALEIHYLHPTTGPDLR